MPVIYLEHAQHGQKVAFSDLEAKFDMSNGWKQFDPVARVEKKEPEKVEAPVERKKPGRPPKVDDVPNFLTQKPVEEDPEE